MGINVKKVVILFIVSTMVFTGISGKEQSQKGDLEIESTSSPKTDDSSEKDVEYESEKETVASIEASGNRFYAKYTEVIDRVFLAASEDNDSEAENETEMMHEEETKVQVEQNVEIFTEEDKETLQQIETVEEETIAQQEEESMIEETGTNECVQENICEEPESIGCLPVQNSSGICVSESDYNELLKIVEAEAGNQDDIGKILVANVIFNRVRNASFPSSVTEVIYQNSNGVYQFEPVLNGRINTVCVSQSTVECVNRALNGEDYSQGAIYFTMKTSQNSWFNRCLTLLFVHGDHYFYTC